MVQGPSTNVEEIKSAWRGYDIIFSTWQGDENHYDKNDIVIFNKIPEKQFTTKHTLYLQRITTLEGLIKAKELGYKKVLKWRSDQIPLDTKNLLSIFKYDKLNVHSFIDSDGGYVSDFFMYGDVNDLIKLYLFLEKNYKFPEQAITEQLFINGLQNKTHFLVQDIDESCEILWKKYNSKYSSYMSQSMYMNRFPIKNYIPTKTGMDIVDVPFKAITPNGIETINVKIFK